MPLAAGQGEDEDEDNEEAEDDGRAAVPEASTVGLSGRSVMGRGTSGEESGVQYDAKADEGFRRVHRPCCRGKKKPAHMSGLQNPRSFLWCRPTSDGRLKLSSLGWLNRSVSDTCGHVPTISRVSRRAF